MAATPHLLDSPLEASEADATPDATPDVAARLMAWMERARFGVAADLEEAARRVEVGLRELAGARAAVVLARRGMSDALRLFAATPGAFPAAPDNGDDEDRSSRLIFGFSMAEAFSLSQAAQPEDWEEDVRQWAHVESASSAPAADESAFSRMPLLCVPLPAPESADSLAMAPASGVALLWLDEGTELPGELGGALHAAAAQAGSWLYAAAREERLGASYRDLAAVFASVLEGRDADREGHSSAVAFYARSISRELGVSEREAAQIEFAALLHDIGRSVLPDSLVQRDVPLSPDERAQVRAALVSGAEGLKGVEGLEEVARIVRHQGERWDGAGYPDGLSGEAIPLGSRILGVALRFAALTRARGDRRALAVVSGALDCLVGESGAALDPQMVRAFLTSMGRAPGEVAGDGEAAAASVEE